VAKAMAVIGDVKNKVAIILDDMVDTAGTLTEAAAALSREGAKEVHAYCSHPVLSGPAVDRINESNLKSVVATDTIPLREEAAACDKINVLSISGLVGEAIIRSFNGDSVTSLFV
jgi:ribose-phosphate pyrophosphokinase